MRNGEFRRRKHFAHVAQFHIALLLQLFQGGRPRSGRAFHLLQRRQPGQITLTRQLHLMRSPWLFQRLRLHQLPRNTLFPAPNFTAHAHLHRLFRIHPRSRTQILFVDFAPSDQKARHPLTRNLHLVKLRNPRGVYVAARTNGIQPHRTHHIPSTHLSAILVANQPVRTVFVKILTHIINDPLRLLRLPTIVIQIRHVMAGLVTVRILSDQP